MGAQKGGGDRELVRDQVGRVECHIGKPTTTSVPFFFSQEQRLPVELSAGRAEEQVKAVVQLRRLSRFDSETIGPKSERLLLLVCG